jgi:glycosyltransferase involved in cell wall biosynthesis
MRRFRVAHVITRLCTGGAQENTLHTVGLANRNRFEVDLISGPTTGAEGSIENKVREAGIAIIREPALVRNAAPVRDVLALRRLTRLFRERRYDIVHTHTSKAGFIGRLAAARAGVPIIVHTPHGNIFDGYFGKPATWTFTLMERYAARRSDRLVALTTRGIDEQLAQRVGTPQQWLAIFSGIDLSPYDAAMARRAETRRELGISPDMLLVGGVGRLEPVKGFPYFVEAARQIAESLPEARFVLVGDGSVRAALAEQAAGLGDRFQFLGLRDDVPDLMAAMDIFVLPSLNEGMGRVLLESSAASTPAVATAVGGVPGIVADGVTGCLTPPRDAAAIAQAVIRLAGDPDGRAALGEAARAFVVPEYGLEKMVAAIEALYERLIEEKHLDT